VSRITTRRDGGGADEISSRSYADLDDLPLEVGSTLFVASILSIRLIFAHTIDEKNVMNDILGMERVRFGLSFLFHSEHFDRDT
jgi:hypothetical protein